MEAELLWLVDTQVCIRVDRDFGFVCFRDVLVMILVYIYSVPKPS